MAISNVGTQDAADSGANPPQDNQDNITEEVVEEKPEATNPEKQEDQNIDLNLDLSDVVKDEEPVDKPLSPVGDLPLSGEEESEEISLDLENSSVAETTDQQINFQDVTPPSAEEKVEEKVEDKTDDLSMDLPTVPSKEKEDEWLKEEDKETVKDEKEVDASGLDLGAISKEKIQESSNSGMLNLDDLGAMATAPVQAAPEINETVAPPVVAPPVVAPPIVSTPAIETPVVETPVMEQPVPPVVPVAAAVMQTTATAIPEPMMNPELNAAYAATAPNTEKKLMHKKMSSSRKIISIVVLVALMLGGGFYIFKTMFPDKAQILTNQPEVVTNTEILAQEEIETETNLEIVPETVTGNIAFEEISATTEEVLPAIDLADNNQDSISTETIPTISGLTHTAADVTTTSGNEFDPFAEIEDILDKTNPNQDKIDILEDLLKIGEEYFALGDMAEDATILKYSRVLTQKIPEDIAMLETGTNLNLDKIDQHISLFETYIKKLEALASID